MSNNSSLLSLKQHLGSEACVELLEFARKLDAKGGPSIDELLTHEITKIDERVGRLDVRIANIDGQIAEAGEATRIRAAELKEGALFELRHYRDKQAYEELLEEIAVLYDATDAAVAKVFRPEQQKLRTKREGLLAKKRELEALLELSK